MDFVSIYCCFFIAGTCSYRGIAVPDVHEDLRDRLTSVGVNELNVHEKRNTLLVLRDVRTDHLTGDICHWLAICQLNLLGEKRTVRTLCHIWTKNAGGIVGEECLRVGVGSQALQVRVVGGVQGRFEVASLDHRSIYTKPGC